MAVATIEAPPTWHAVETLLAHLAETRAKFGTDLAVTNWISAYEPGERFLRENENGSSWVRVDSVHGCWETFERLGRIGRKDVLEPGRCSAFMMALFSQVPGVRREGDDLVLPSAD